MRIAIGADHAVYENDGSWHNLGGSALDLSASEHLMNVGGQMVEVDEVYAIGADHGVWKNDGSWQQRSHQHYSFRMSLS